MLKKSKESLLEDVFDQVRSFINFIKAIFDMKDISFDPEEYDAKIRLKELFEI